MKNRNQVLTDFWKNLMKFKQSKSVSIMVESTFFYYSLETYRALAVAYCVPLQLIFKIEFIKF